MRGKFNNQSNTYPSVLVSSLRYLMCHLKLIVSHWFKDLEIGEADEEVLEFCDLPLANIVQNSEHWIRDKLSERSTTQGTQHFTQYKDRRSESDAQNPADYANYLHGRSRLEETHHVSIVVQISIFCLLWLARLQTTSILPLLLECREIIALSFSYIYIYIYIYIY